MKKVVRLSENDLSRLVRRIIREEEESMDLPRCESFMKSQGGGGMPVPGDSSMLSGPIDKITSTPPSPEMGYIVHKDGRPFCFIPNR